MASIAVLIPVLNRPQRVAPLTKNLAECSAMIECHPYFVCTRDDEEERSAVRDSFADGATEIVLPGELLPGDYARKINWGVSHTSERFIFLGADDLIFHPGWAERAIATWYESGSCVIGTNDLANQTVMDGKHSTHSLIHRDYVECGTIDEEGKVLHEGYSHNFVDNEFIGTAIARDTYTQAMDCFVEHTHPIWHTADNDPTYERGRRDHSADNRLFVTRERLWA